MTQKEALEILKMGENVFLTGPAGSGKTFLLNQYIEYLKANKIKVGVTASTGIAATHINGITIHSWSGIGIKDKLNRKEFRRLLNNEDLQKRILQTSVLVIDEISMFDNKRLDLVNDVCQAFRNSAEHFGGMQVIFCGDFFQLPPVNTNNNDSIYAFKSDIWHRMKLRYCYLEDQYRHEDKKYLKVLNDIRSNKVKENTLLALKDRINRPVRGNITPTKLFTKNIDVDAINRRRLELINEAPHIYDMKEECRPKKKFLLENLRKRCLARQSLELRKGAVVMFLRNKFKKESDVPVYVNGTLGIVVGFSEFMLPIVEMSNGNTIVAEYADWSVEEDEVIQAKISQIPLCLAWAITVHKSQGMSLDEAVIDLSGAFEYGMGYVALSRVRSFAGLSLLGINRTALQVSPEILERDKKFRSHSDKLEIEYRKISVRDRIKTQKEFLKKAKISANKDLFARVFN